MEIEEEPSRIVIRLRFNKYGAMGDDNEFAAHVLPIVEKYDKDPRPIVMDHSLTGEVATIYGDENNSVAFLRNAVLQ